MTIFALSTWRRVPEQARALLHGAERDAGRGIHRAPALAGIECGDQPLAVSLLRSAALKRHPTRAGRLHHSSSGWYEYLETRPHSSEF